MPKISYKGLETIDEAIIMKDKKYNKALDKLIEIEDKMIPKMSEELSELFHEHDSILLDLSGIRERAIYRYAKII